MSDLFYGMFTLKYVISNLVWTILLMIIARALEWVRGKPFETQRRASFWVVAFLGIFVVISILTYAAKGPTSPDLRGGFDALTITILPGSPQNAVGVLVIFNVRNVGTPSIADNYSLTVTPPGRGPIEAVPLFIPKVLSVPPAPGTPQGLPFTIVCGKDALYRKTGEQPLAYGGVARGFLWYELEGYAPHNFSNPIGTNFRMTFTDVLNNKYAADFTWPSVPKSSGYLPGLIIPKSDKPEEACE